MNGPSRQDGDDPAALLGPFNYGFRPGPAGPFGTIYIRAPRGAPMPKAGDILVMTTHDCYDADFEVVEVTCERTGWWASCERRRPR